MSAPIPIRTPASLKCLFIKDLPQPKKHGAGASAPAPVPEPRKNLLQRETAATAVDGMLRI